jgi:hypothetical protein
MKFCPVVPEICRGQVHVPKKERRIKRIIIRNGAKTISIPNFVWGLIQGCFSGDMSLFVVSDSGLFFRRHVLFFCV